MLVAAVISLPSHVLSGVLGVAAGAVVSRYAAPRKMCAGEAACSQLLAIGEACVSAG